MAVSTIDPNGLNIGQIGGRRNILINSDFQISQRGDYTTASSITNGEFFVDRWYIDIAGINGTKQQTTGLDITGASVIGNGAKLAATSTAGSSYLGMRQKVENPTQFVGRTLTYSGYVRSNSSNARLATFISGTDQSVTSDPHTGDGTWQKLSVTFTMTGNPTTAWYIDAFIIGASYANVSITSGDYIEVAFLQMELGDVATPFEHRSAGEELLACQRYYHKIDKRTVTACGHWGGLEPFIVEMRGAPTASYTAVDTVNQNGAAATEPVINDLTKQRYQVYWGYSGTLATTYSNLAFDAEL